MSSPSAEERMATAERLLGLEVLAREAAEHERDELRAPIPKSYACQQCGRRDGLDAAVTDALWEQISGRIDGGGLLCLWCMDVVAAGKGIDGAVMLHFAGKALVGSGGPTIWDDHLLTDQLLEAEDRTVRTIVERDKQHDEILECQRLLQDAKDEARQERAEAERLREWAPILETAKRQDEKWLKPMPEFPSHEAVFVWALKAQEELGEMSAALLAHLIGKEGRGDPLAECYETIAVLLRIAVALEPRNKEALPFKAI